MRGYSRRRFRTVPDRDLYAVAGAVVASAMWLAVVWLLLLEVGNPVEDWGLVPLDDATLEKHPADVVWLGLAVIFIPYVLGIAAAAAVDALSDVRQPRVWGFLRRTGFFKPPTAWDRAWLRFLRQQGSGEVIVRLSSGSVIRGGFGDRSQADLSPNAKDLYLESCYELKFDPNGNAVVGLVGERGVYLSGTEIDEIYFLAPEHGATVAPKPDTEDEKV